MTWSVGNGLQFRLRKDLIVGGEAFYKISRGLVDYLCSFGLYKLAHVKKLGAGSLDANYWFLDADLGLQMNMPLNGQITY
jgi:hypothetical protein